MKKEKKFFALGIMMGRLSGSDITTFYHKANNPGTWAGLTRVTNIFSWPQTEDLNEIKVAFASKVNQIFF